MKIEKVNDNQIRCILTSEDLAERQIKISELAYGTEKAKLLFRDMIQQASYEFGFEADDIPLMIEAIPLSADSIILIITKVEQPDELDTRFSKFSEPDPEDIYEDSYGDFREFHGAGADELLTLLREMEAEEEADFAEGTHDYEDEEDLFFEEVSKTNPAKAVIDMVRLFVFKDLTEAIRLAYVLKGFYKGKNDLYKDVFSHKYYLFISKDAHTPEEFNKVCNILSEYASPKMYTPAVKAFFEEHYQKLISENALQMLAEL